MNRKLIVFVPREALDAVRDALFAAGAGRIGDYERCSWYTAGTGTFLGGEGTSPSVGQAGREERVAELRLETVFPAERQDEVIAALRSAHPTRSRRSTIYELLLVKARLFTDGGARGNPGPAAFGYVLEAEDGTVLAAHGEAIGVATNNVAEYRALVAGLERGGRAAGGGGRGRLRLRAAREADDAASTASRTRRCASSPSRRRALARQVGKRALHRRAAGAQRARRPARERGSGRRRPRLDCASHADVAQLARASACHAEGRGFESHHPLSLSKAPLRRAFYALSR